MAFITGGDEQKWTAASNAASNSYQPKSRLQRLWSMLRNARKSTTPRTEEQ